MFDIHLLGVARGKLDPDAVDRIATCAAVVASRRHLELVHGLAPKIIAMAPLGEMLDTLEDELKRGEVAVLASGDPLFFGIGRTLIRRFGRDRLRVYPALSSIQLACARLREPWDDLEFLSLHGRAGGYLPGLILGRSRVMLFTDHRNTPDGVARNLLSILRELDAREEIHGVRAAVVENAGLPDERITRGTLEEIASSTFGPLNLMLITQPGRRAWPRLGLGEKELAHSRGLITKDEVRAAVLHQLRLPPGGVMWDVGAGSGSVAVAAGRLNPELHVLAVERRGEELENIRKNIVTHGVYNVQPVAGTAPEVLTGLKDPDRIFVGGSGGRLEEILRFCAGRLRAGGRIVVSSVLARTARQAPEILHDLGLLVEMREIAVRRWKFGESTRQTMNPITLITGWKE